MGVRVQGDSPVLPVHNVGRALDLGAAVVCAPRVDDELDVPALELALRRVLGAARPNRGREEEVITSM